MNNTKTLIDNSEFLELVENYLPIISTDTDKSINDVLKNKLNNIESPEINIPVLGIQGSGKSAFLNSLLFDDEILPVDVLETTCVPVEIRYHAKDTLDFFVYFKNGEKRKLDTHHQIADYVDNEKNKANKKKVSHVIIFSNHKLLYNNFVFVDLPGVGSLTPENIKVTMDYVQKLSGFIFLLRTIPPMDRSEALFIKEILPNIIKPWFIMNQWNDENEKDVEVSRSYSEMELKNVYKRQNIDSENPKIEIVNVYQAEIAAYSNNNKLREKSGIALIYEDLLLFSKDWKVILKQNFDLELNQMIKSIQNSIVAKLERASLNDEEFEKFRMKEETKLKNILTSNEKLYNEILSLIENFQLDAESFSADESQKQTENLRNEMRRIIRGGIVDGQRLNNAYKDNCKEIYLDSIESVEYKIHEFSSELQEKLDKLKLFDFKGNTFTAGEFYRKDKRKYEKLFEPVLGITGAFVGLKVGGIAGPWIGAKIGAAIGGSIGGPVGVAAGFIVGIGIVLAFKWIGKKGKDVVAGVRKKYALSDLRKPIEDFKITLHSEIEKVFSEFFEYIRNILSNLKKEQETEFEQINKMHEKEFKSRKVNLEKNKYNLNEDLIKTKKLFEVLNG